MTRPDRPPDPVPAALRRALAEGYALERELGRGGMATVYLAQDRKHGRPVAIKVLHPELASSVGVERFVREIGIAARLQHPNILTLIDSGSGTDAQSDEHFLFYVMPFVEGVSLRERLARDGALAPPEAVRLLREIVDGVAHAHRHGVMHRDIKPDNVLLAGQHALLVDFGVARAMSDAREEKLTATGISLGTPSYMAPEQAAGDPAVDHRADLYAIGLVAYEILTGTAAFSGTPQSVLAAQISAAPRPLHAVRPGIPPALERVVNRCLEKNPAQRFQTADELLLALDALSATAVSPGRRRRTAFLAGGAITVIVLLIAGAWRVQRQRWVHEYAIPGIQRLVDAGDNDSAFALAQRAAAISPSDALLNSLWPQFAQTLSFTTVPAGASVERARVDDTTHWHPVGTTPTGPVRVPDGVIRYRIRKTGFREVLLFSGGIPGVTSPPLPDTVRLDSAAAPDSDMVRIPGGLFPAELIQLRHLPSPALGDFRIDRVEVTNAAYKAFVDAGGYRRREFWEHEFAAGGRRLTWDEGMKLLVDRTGRPGPSTWEAGSFPAGQGDLPVGGVSWYEAMAFAKYAGKSVPTLYHWVRAAGTSTAALSVTGSNFEGQGPVRGGSFHGMGPWGTFDMGGNLREWTSSPDDEGQYYILGGGWSDPAYRFSDAFAQPPLERSPINGLRLVRYLDSHPDLARASAPIARQFRDYWKERPATDAVFATYRQMYDYDQAPLNATVLSRDTTPPDWIREQVAFDAPYGQERVLANVYLPKRGAPPYQTAVLFPGTDAIFTRASNDAYALVLRFLITNGRVLVLPVYQSTYERTDAYNITIPNETIAYRDHMVMWGKDLRRTIDYLSTRGDVDTTRLAFLGISWGGRIGPVMMAIEPRFRAGIVYVAGFSMSTSRPEVDPLHFLPRVHVPVLMLNGKHDHLFPVESAQRPYFELLGTPADRRKYVLYEGGHFVPQTILIAESLNWLDRYLGAPGAAVTPP
jgi:hypothetical protein